MAEARFTPAERLGYAVALGNDFQFSFRRGMMRFLFRHLSLKVRMSAREFLMLLAFGDVSHRAENHNAVFGLDRTERDIRGEFAAVLAQRHQVAGGAHGSRFRMTEELLALTIVLLPKPGGNQDFEGLVEELVALITEQFFRLDVDEYNSPARIDNDHRIGRGIEKIAE